MSSYQIQTLVQNILKYYMELELNCANDYNFWCNSEFDSNLTEFERLSNLHLINVKTNLNKRNVKVVIHILSSIVQENYYMFEPDAMDDYLDDSIIDQYNQYNEDKAKLYKYNCPKLWVKWLRIVLENNTIVQTNDIIIVKNKFEYISLELKDINVDLRLTETKMVAIIK